IRDIDRPGGCTVRALIWCRRHLPHDRTPPGGEEARSNLTISVTHESHAACGVVRTNARSATCAEVRGLLHMFGVCDRSKYRVHPMEEGCTVGWDRAWSARGPRRVWGRRVEQRWGFGDHRRDGGHGLSGSRLD